MLKQTSEGQFEHDEVQRHEWADIKKQIFPGY